MHRMLIIVGALALALVFGGSALAQKVKLISSGTGTKNELTYSPKKGMRGSMKITLNMRAHAKVQGQKMEQGSIPTLTYAITSTIKSVDKDGNFEVHFKINSARVAKAKAKELHKQALKKLQGALASLKKIGITSRFSKRGVLLGSKADGKKVEDPLLFQLAQFLVRTLEQVVLPLPQEKVGKGAKWSIAQTGKNMGITLKSETRYELKSVSRKNFHIGIALVQRAKKQTVKMGMASVELKTFKGSGKGEYKTGPQVVAPVATFALETAYKLVGKQQGKSQQVEMEIAYAFKMAKTP